MDLKELQNFDLSDFAKIGSAPVAIRGLLAALVLGSVVGLGYYLHTRDQLDSLKNVEGKELALKETFERKNHQAANLEAYKVQLAEMEKEFGTMLRQLPGKTEIPAVILDVSQTGLASGLKIMLFKPQSESTKGFYAEKPIQIRLRGNYHEMAKFSSGIASLPRIVTLHDIVLKPEQGTNKLIMDVTAKTYRYLADDEVEDNKGPGNA